MPGPSSPDGVAGRVSSAPSSLRRLGHRRHASAASPPSARASACAVSLPELSSRPAAAAAPCTCPPGPMPGPAAVDRVVLRGAVDHRVRVEPVDATSAVSTFSVDAGRCRACGARAASTAPVSRSARTKPRRSPRRSGPGRRARRRRRRRRARPAHRLGSGHGSGAGADAGVSSTAAGGGGACGPGTSRRRRPPADAPTSTEHREGTASQCAHQRAAATHRTSRPGRSDARPR